MGVVTCAAFPSSAKQPPTTVGPAAAGIMAFYRPSKPLLARARTSLERAEMRLLRGVCAPTAPSGYRSIFVSAYNCVSLISSSLQHRRCEPTLTKAGEEVGGRSVRCGH